MENQKYCTIHKRYLSEALSFLGFRYYKFDKPDGGVEYSFENTEKFRKAFSKLLELKKSIDDYEKNN